MTFSPDGGYIYFLRTGRDEIYPSLYMTPVFGGEPKKLISQISSSITFSPDGKRIAFIRNPPIKNENYLVLSDPDRTNRSHRHAKDSEGFKTRWTSLVARWQGNLHRVSTNRAITSIR
jgi:Tol biopolymer transport system component